VGNLPSHARGCRRAPAWTPSRGFRFAPLRGTLAELDRNLNDPANRRRPGRQVLERLTSSLRVGSGGSARFDRALAAYRKVVDQCELRAR
jgi:hypothetical protein